MGEQLDLGIDYGWFHVLRARVMDGLISEIGETALAVYVTLKAHADHHTGRAQPSQDRIAKLIGKSVDTVGRATKVLIEHGLIQEEKRGRYKEYVLMEQAPVLDRSTGTPQGTVDWQYVPKEFAAQLQALKAFITEGIPPGRGITLNLTVNMIQQRDSGTVNMQNVTIEAKDAEGVASVAKRLRMLNS
jgi:DNA-binding transcriptional ArsR family regulator